MNKQTKKLLTYGAVGSVIVIILLLVAPASLSITEVACSGTNVWIKYDLKDEGTQLAGLIQDCKDNPTGGWVGTIHADAITPKGNTYGIGGYSATSTSTQKISCGGSQDGKSFMGTYIPNEGYGLYDVKLTGTYYLKSENYAKPHQFSIQDTKSIHCTLPASKCFDDTPLNSCSSVTKGKYCSADGYLIDYAVECGCPSGYQAVGDKCQVVKPAEVEQEIPPSSLNQTTTVEQPAAGQPTITAPTTTSNESGDLLIYGMERKTIILGLAALALLMGGVVYFRK
jgi:hypothetical protein